MKIQITQPNLQKALGIMSRVASSKTQLPILNNVLIKTVSGGIEFSATNLEVAVTHKANGKVNKEGQLTVPARLLHDFVSQLPKSETVELSFEKNKLFIKAGTYSSHIQGTSTEDFPALPEVSMQNALTIEPSVLQAILNKTLMAASHDETRPILSGVYIHTHEKELYFTATDGYRLAEARIKKVDHEIEGVVPTAALQDVFKISQEADQEVCQIVFADGQFAFSAGNTQLVSRLVEGSYPEYRKLIPESSEVSFVVEKEALHTAAKLAGLFARESGGSITVSASESDSLVTIASVASQVGDNSSAIKAEVSGDGEVVVNVRYLNDALNCFSGSTINFRFGGSLAPCVLTSKQDEGYQHIVMPLKS